MYDVAIVGGGPAGATLARLIGRSYKVLLLEKRSFDSNSAASTTVAAASTAAADISPADEKCCGGLVSPDAQRMLARFGLGIPGQVLRSPQLFAVRAIDVQSMTERYYQRFYMNIDRHEFDRWLLSIIPSMVDIMYGCVFKSFEADDDCVAVKYARDGVEHVDKARLLVGADGAYSKVRRQGFSDKPVPDLYLAIQEWFETQDARNFYGAIFDNEITDYYSWTIPKENSLILGTALKIDVHGKIDTETNVNQKFELLKRKLERFGFAFGNMKSIKKRGAYLYRPVRTGQICTGCGNIALIGEAAGFISPSSAEGLSYAFRSSLALAGALKSRTEGGLREGQTEGLHKRYTANLRPLMRNISIKNLKSPVMYNTVTRKIIMKTGLMAIDMEDDMEDDME